MSLAYIEHVNLTVTNPARTAEMLISLFGWHIRWQGPARAGGYSIHVGSDDHYLALYGAAQSSDTSRYFSKGAPLNHIGIAVDDLADVEARAIKAGLKPFDHDDYDPGRRFYFLDQDGIEYEVISYNINDRSQRV